MRKINKYKTSKFKMGKRLCWLFFLFFSAYGHGQNGAGDDPAAFHEEGKTLMEKENPSAFERAAALGKFRKSQQVLNQSEKKNEALQNDNSKYIDVLFRYFSDFNNSDSILRTTVFYPDSAFQANTQFSDRAKEIIPQLIEVKRRKRRKDFSQIEALNYRDQNDSEGASFILTFERYWPLEVIEFERYILNKKSEFRGLAPAPTEALLYAHLKNELDSINFEIKNNSLELNVKHIQQQKESIEEELTTAKGDYSKLKTIGFAVIGLVLLWAFFFRRKSSQLLKSVNQNLLEEKKRSEELLLNILPAEVAKELKKTASVKAKKHKAVTVLFSDFKNFSQIAERLSPEELVMELDYCFKAFDRIIDKHRLQKIKTIGDAYMCVGGLYTQGSNHIGRIILAALEIQRFLNNLKKEREAQQRTFFEARIGIHIGPVVAGVVGSKQFAFDIWGDTVNVAQQMETNGQPGKVNISGEVYAFIKDQFECTHRGMVTVKNKNEYEMYFVEGQLNG